MCCNALYKDGERPAPPRADNAAPDRAPQCAPQPGADYDYDPLESINILTPAEDQGRPLTKCIIGQDAAKRCWQSRSTTTISAFSPARTATLSCKSPTS